MREENFWCKKPRYSEVRVIARRVIARYDYNSLPQLYVKYRIYTNSTDNINPCESASRLPDSLIAATLALLAGSDSLIG